MSIEKSIENKANLIKFAASPPRYNASIMVNNEGKEMIEQTATVVSVESGYAWIIPQQKAGGCGGCAHPQHRHLILCVRNPRKCGC